MRTTLNLCLEIQNIEVNDGYYSFSYTYSLNGKKKKSHYDSDYDGYTEKEFKKVLEKGHALQIALQQIAEDVEMESLPPTNTDK